MTNKNILFMTQLALLIAIEVIMKLLGLGSVPVGPLNMSFLTVPVAVGAIVCGPLMGTLLGLVFGLCSFYDALAGKSAMTGAFLGISPIHTFILCVGMRLLMGLCTGLIAKSLKNLTNSNIRYFISAICAPLLNTLFFMSYIVLIFYKTDYVQNLVNLKGATNPIMFIILLVGMQGLVEAVVCAIIGGSASKACDMVVNKK